MTVSSLSKKFSVSRILLVEKVEIEGHDQDSKLIISAHPHKREMYRCSDCEQKSPRYNRGNDLRRCRSPAFGSGMKVYVEAKAP